MFSLCHELKNITNNNWLNQNQDKKSQIIKLKLGTKLINTLFFNFYLFSVSFLVHVSCIMHAWSLLYQCCCLVVGVINYMFCFYSFGANLGFGNWTPNEVTTPGPGVASGLCAWSLVAVSCIRRTGACRLGRQYRAGLTFFGNLVQNALLW